MHTKWFGPIVLSHSHWQLESRAVRVLHCASKDTEDDCHKANTNVNNAGFRMMLIIIFHTSRMKKTFSVEKPQMSNKSVHENSSGYLWKIEAVWLYRSLTLFQGLNIIFQNGGDFPPEMFYRGGDLCTWRKLCNFYYRPLTSHQIAFCRSRPTFFNYIHCCNSASVAPFSGNLKLTTSSINS